MLSTPMSYLAHRGVSPDAMIRFDLGYDSDARALTIPAVRSGIQVGTLYHYLAPADGCWYRWKPGSLPWLFNGDAITHPSTGIAVITKGVMDALTVWDCLGRVGEPKSVLVSQAEACGLPGAWGWQSDYASLFAGKRVVVLVADDFAGRAMLANVSKDLEGFSSAIMPGGMDVNDFARARGRLNLRRLIEDLADDCSEPVRIVSPLRAA
ncbi:hypothetical protein AB0C14_22710 [Microbispora hainanensis]|uniref:hypothetical protein n=1 Tax=Microbispora hainanensis TaxID=568844 RepID=UPI0033E959A1